MYMYFLVEKQLFVADPHQVALQHITFCTVQSNRQVTNRSPKMMPTWLYRHHFALYQLNRLYNELRQKLIEETSDFSISHAFLWKSH
ncbi:hypothetical protein TNCV_524131 [Trichonephila clavipes]|nr:hypothetical protein TNCV_524131 [Trichonephila clavipes]